MLLHNLFQPIVHGSKDRIRESFPALAKETFPLITVDKKCIKQKRNDFVAVPFFALAPRSLVGNSQNSSLSKSNDLMVAKSVKKISFFSSMLRLLKT